MGPIQFTLCGGHISPILTASKVRGLRRALANLERVRLGFAPRGLLIFQLIARLFGTFVAITL
jgi:hypothetical protein